MADFPLPPPPSETFIKHNGGPPIGVMRTAAAVFGGLMVDANGLAVADRKEMVAAVEAAAQWALFLAEKLHEAADVRYPNG